jgi:hypothetical protein
VTAIPMPLTPSEQERALDIARAMARAGIPMFVAPPCRCSQGCRGRTSGFHLPPRWEHTTPDPSAVDGWQPGWALCAVGGHACDFLDVDPRNGGAESAAELQRAGAWPVSYGSQATPSGGRHELIQPLRAGKGALRRDSGDGMGIDLQGGRPDGTGRGFVFLAPTQRASKVDGVRRAYRWLREPDLTRLAARRGEHSGAGLVKLLPQRSPVTSTAERPHEIFIDLTPVRADELVSEACRRVGQHAASSWSGFRETLCLDAAYTLGGLVGAGYLQAGEAQHKLTEAISEAGHTPNDDDVRWIEDGITEGARKPIWVQKPRPEAPPGSPPLITPNLPDEFWESRKTLSEIRALAHAKAISADGVLGIVLARLSSILPGELTIDTGIMHPASLNFFTILLGTSAAGKTSQAQNAGHLFPLQALEGSEDHHIGSGQGIAAAYGQVIEGEFQQTRYNAMFHADEGEGLFNIAKNKENTTLATIRTCWSGVSFGQRNATAELSRRVKDYSMGLWIGLQEEYAAELFSVRRENDGTLQRFCWFNATDPSIPLEAEAPPPVSWDLSAAYSAREIFVPDWLRKELRYHRWLINHGELIPEAGRKHESLTRIKIACLLGILDGRHDISREDWELAGVVFETSHAVAQTARDAAARRCADAERASNDRRLRWLDDEAKHREKRAQSRLEALRARAVTRVTEEPGIGLSKLVRRLVMSTERELGEQAIELAIDAGLITAQTNSQNQGQVLFPAS